MSTSQRSSRRPRRNNRRAGDSNKVAVSKFAGDAYSLADRAYKGVKQVMRLINIETKFFNTSLQTTVTSTPTIASMQLMTQGVDVSNRVGDSIRLQGIDFNYYIFQDNTTPGVGYMRVILFRDNQCDGVMPTEAELLDMTIGDRASAPMSYINKGRFGVLHDEVWALSSGRGTNFIKRQTIPHMATSSSLPTGLLY
jgi:hypothetical protein